MIEVEHLTKQFKVQIFKKIVAVNDVSFTVNDGEVVGLLGPNGAGKTTIMRLLATVLHPTQGTARVDAVRYPHTSAGGAPPGGHSAGDMGIV